MDELFPQSVGDEEPSPAGMADLQWHAVPAKRSGVIQMVDDHALLRSAIENDVVIRMECRIGDFVVRGTPIASTTVCEGAKFERLQDQIEAAFKLNRTRTVEQDAAFGIRQIVDVALRALSPSMNDTTTGVMCVNHLTDVMSHVAARHVQSPFRRKDGALRVIATRPDFPDLLLLAFDQVQFAGRNNPPILKRILWGLGVISMQTRVPERCEALARCSTSVANTAAQHMESGAERDEITRSARSLARQLCPTLPAGTAA